MSARATIGTSGERRRFSAGVTGPEMRRVAARAVPAEVIEHQAARDGAADELVGTAMRARAAQLAVAGAAESTAPGPAGERAAGAVDVAPERAGAEAIGEREAAPALA